MKYIKLVLFLILLSSLFLFATPVTGNKTVTVAGTPETLVAASAPVLWIDIQADCDNTDQTYVGFDATPLTGGLELDGCDSIRWHNVDAVDIYVDVEISGEGVHYWYEPAG